MSEPCILFYIVDDLNRFIDSFTLNSKTSDEPVKSEEGEVSSEKCSNKISAIFKGDGYFLSAFNRLIKSSEVYSRMVVNHLLNTLSYTPGDSDVVVKFKLVKPKLEIIDYGWNERLENLIAERHELEHAMSWLSTLGGAFSALGDNFENCAKVAGKISVQQLQIALRLGEPPLVARCRIYMAVSLIQLGKLSTAKSIIEQQYKNAKNLKDVRLQNMCKGVWAKLQYMRKEHHKKNSRKYKL